MTFSTSQNYMCYLFIFVAHVMNKYKHAININIHKNKTRTSFYRHANNPTFIHSSEVMAELQNPPDGSRNIIILVEIKLLNI